MNKKNIYSMMKTAFIILLSGLLHQNLIAQNTETEKAKELFKERGDKNKLQEGINQMREMVGRDTIQAVAVILSHTYYLMAEYETEKDKKLEVYEMGLKYGEIALNKIPAFAMAKKENKTEEEALALLTKNDIEVLYWTAANLAKFAKYNTFTKKVSMKSRIRAMWDKVYNLDPNFFYAGGYRFFGGYYALVPAITGDQDPVKSKEMFDKCLEIAPEYLETKVLYAEAYCTHAKIKDRELFKKLLNEVMNAELDAYPDIMPENLIAQEKAKRLLEQEGELFE